VRLFLAADLDPKLVIQAGRLVDRAKSALSTEAVRWIPETNWHVTLAFLGERQESELPGIEEFSGEIVRNFDKAEMQLFRVEPFPQWATARVLALTVGFALPNEMLAFEEAFRKGHRQQNFRPHITVARLRQPGKAQLREIEEKLRSLPGFPGIYYWPVPSITLYESILHPEGSQYEALKTWTL